MTDKSFFSQKPHGPVRRGSPEWVDGFRFRSHLRGSRARNAIFNWKYSRYLTNKGEGVTETMEKNYIVFARLLEGSIVSLLHSYLDKARASYLRDCPNREDDANMSPNARILCDLIDEYRATWPVKSRIITRNRRMLYNAALENLNYIVHPNLKRLLVESPPNPILHTAIPIIVDWDLPRERGMTTEEALVVCKRLDEELYDDYAHTRSFWPEKDGEKPFEHWKDEKSKESSNHGIQRPLEYRLRK